MPQGKAVLAPIMAGEYDYSVDTYSKTEEVLNECAYPGIQGGTMQVIAYGLALKNLQSCGVETLLFKFIVPVDNIVRL
jgi:hypothetical protein